MVQRLTLNDQDNDFFVRSIISASGDTNAPPNANATWQSNHRMLKASEIINDS